MMVGGKYPVYSSQTTNKGIVGYTNEYLYENAITWTTDGANAGDVNYRSGKFYCTNVCGVLLNDYGNANVAMANIINRKTKSYVSYVGNPKLMNNIMSIIKINIPIIEEQKKISNLLCKIDILINEKEMEICLIRKCKAKLLDLFFNNILYNTETVRLKDYFEILKNYSFSREKESDNGTIHHIHYGDIHTSLPSIITSNILIPKLEKCTKYDVKDFIQANDIVIADASEDYKDLGKTIFIDKIEDMKILSGLHTFHLRPYNYIYSIYFKYYTESQGYKKQMARLGTGLSVFGISKSNLVNVTFPIPTDKNIIENISNTLLYIDNLIKEKETELSKQKEIKKYLTKEMLI